MGAARCPDCGFKGLYNADTGVEERAQNPSPSRLSLHPDAESHWAQGLQVDNEYHTAMTTCTFMGRGGRTSPVGTLTRMMECPLVNQTITERPARHLQNAPLIYGRSQEKKAVSLSSRA